MKTFTYALEYRKNGDFGVKPIKIDFTCMDIVRRQAEIEKDSLAFQLEYATWKSKADKWKEIKDDKSKEKESAKLLIELYEAKQKLEKAEHYQTLFDRALENVQLALKQNGVKDEDLFTREFWESCVSPDVVYELSAAVAGKDFDDKKKLPESAADPIR